LWLQSGRCPCCSKPNPSVSWKERIISETGPVRQAFGRNLYHYTWEDESTSTRDEAQSLPYQWKQGFEIRYTVFRERGYFASKNVVTSSSPGTKARSPYQGKRKCFDIRSHYRAIVDFQLVETPSDGAPVVQA
jgi:hypothetical protein